MTAFMRSQTVDKVTRPYIKQKNKKILLNDIKNK